MEEALTAPPPAPVAPPAPPVPPAPGGPRPPRALPGESRPGYVRMKMYGCSLCDMENDREGRVLRHAREVHGAKKVEIQDNGHVWRLAPKRKKKTLRVPV